MSKYYFQLDENQDVNHKIISSKDIATKPYEQLFCYRSYELYYIDYGIRVYLNNTIIFEVSNDFTEDIYCESGTFRSYDINIPSASAGSTLRVEFEIFGGDNQDTSLVDIFRRELPAGIQAQTAKLNLYPDIKFNENTGNDDDCISIGGFNGTYYDNTAVTEATHLEINLPTHLDVSGNYYAEAIGSKLTTDNIPRFEDNFTNPYGGYEAFEARVYIDNVIVCEIFGEEYFPIMLERDFYSRSGKRLELEIYAQDYGEYLLTRDILFPYNLNQTWNTVVISFDTESYSRDYAIIGDSSSDVTKIELRGQKLLIPDTDDTVPITNVEIPGLDSDGVLQVKFGEKKIIRPVITPSNATNKSIDWWSDGSPSDVILFDGSNDIKLLNHEGDFVITGNKVGRGKLEAWTKPTGLFVIPFEVKQDIIQIAHNNGLMGTTIIGGDI